jgi:hypothetical protein
MESTLYSNLGGKINRNGQVPPELNESVTIKEIINNISHYKFISLDEVTLVQAYVNELKLLLDEVSIQNMIQMIFSIENQLTSLVKELQLDFEIPNLDQCYKKLSPLFLRTMHEAFEVDKTTDTLMAEWLEVFRIAIEEEYYIWQEKYFDLIEKK